jgi:hypothetical protein
MYSFGEPPSQISNLNISVLADSFDADNDPLFYAGDKVGRPLFTRIMSQDISLQFFFMNH